MTFLERLAPVGEVSYAWAFPYLYVHGEMEAFSSALKFPDRTKAFGSSCRGTISSAKDDFLCNFNECFDWPPVFSTAAASVVIIIIIIATTHTT